MAERRFRYNDGTVVTQGTDTPSTSTASDSLKNLSISMANQTPTSAITSSTLTPQPAFQIPQVAPSTSLAGELGALETRSSFNTEISKQRQDREKTAYDAYGKLFENMLGQKGETGLTTDAYSKKGGVDNIQVELDDINQQLLEEQESLRRRIETIQDNKEGMFRSGVEGEINRVQRESLRKQADLSVIQMGIQGRFDSAKAIADRAVQAQLEQQKQQNEALSLYASLNWDLFTKAEQREFEVAQGDREREYRKEEKALQEISDYSLVALQGGAPTSVVSQMRGAKTPEEAIRIGGQYIGALDRAYKTAQIQQIGLENLEREGREQDLKNGILDEKQIAAIDKSPQGKSLTTLSNLKLKMNAYQSLVEKYGFEAFGTKKAELENAYTELQLSYKEAANLGVLNGPDLALVEKAIKSATPGFFGNIGNILTLGAGTKNLTANLEQAQTTLNDSATQNLEQLYARDPVYRDSLYIQSFLLPFGDEIITQEELAQMDAEVKK